ncbi:MAG TPA: ISKra4 family transposase [Chromatiaceae bacterium]|nr:ISKra4 family transposase [Chromatiaceae bacterium]
MTNTMLVDSIMDRLRGEVETLVANADLETDVLDEIEEKGRQFALKCGAAAFEAILERTLEKQGYGYQGESVPSVGEGRARFERYETRWVLTHLGRFRVRRAYYWDASNGTGRIPLDEKWDLDEREPSPSLRRSIGMVGAASPFAHGHRLIKQLALVDLPVKRLQESSEALGDKIRLAAEEAARQSEPMLRDPKVGLPEVSSAERRGTLYIQMDGGRLNTITEGWREPKVATVYWADEVVEVSKDRREVLKKEYVATLGDADDLAKRVWELACRWKWWTALHVVILGDGAEWIWNRAKELFPEAVQILDLFHVEEHIWEVARKMYGGRGPQKDKGARNVIKLSAKDIKTGKWARARIEELKRGDIDAIIADLRRRRPRRQEAKNAVKELIGYLDGNRCRMDYPTYVDKGFIVGSGSIESGVKNVVNQRMKGCGMRWAVDRAENMLHLRAAYLSDVGPGHNRLAA